MLPRPATGMRDLMGVIIARRLLRLARAGKVGLHLLSTSLTLPNGVVFTDRDDRKRRETTLLCVLGVRYNFGTTEGEKEWVSGSKATPNEAVGFFDLVVGI